MLTIGLSILFGFLLICYIATSKNKWRIVEIKKTHQKTTYKVQDLLFSSIPFIWWTYSNEFDSLDEAKSWINEHVVFLESLKSDRKIERQKVKNYIRYTPFDSNGV